ncbi:MAG TPA: hypothetical protein VIM10_14725 [Actinopolymorphaceae bacterium]
MWALGWRLQRTSLITWTVSSALLGLLMGGASRSIGGQLDSQQLKDVMARIGSSADPVDLLFAAVLAIIAEVIAAYAIVAALRLRREEIEGLAGPLLATPVSRWAWSVSTLVWVFVGPAIALAVLGASTGLAYGSAGAALKLSPFAAAPNMLVGESSPATCLLWTLIAVALSVVGLMTLRRRDLAAA